MNNWTKDNDIYRGIRFAVSRMGLQLNSEKEERMAELFYSEYLRVQERKDSHGREVTSNT